jgi:hypothetical protein
MVQQGTPLRRTATSMELPPPSPSQAPNFTQPTLEADDFVRWGKDLRSNSVGSGVFGGSSGYSSVHGELASWCSGVSRVILVYSLSNLIFRLVAVPGRFIIGTRIFTFHAETSYLPQTSFPSFRFRISERSIPWLPPCWFQ